MNLLKLFESILKAALAFVTAVISVVKAIGNISKAKT